MDTTQRRVGDRLTHDLNIPDGRQGCARVDRVTITPKQAFFANLGCMHHPLHRVAEVEPGEYTRLIVGGELMMSDTRLERMTNTEVVRHANGHVLIAGLGLGLIILPMLAMPQVTSITVLEKCKDVIDLVGPTLCEMDHDSVLRIIEADAFAWRPDPGKLYDTIYFDIWPTISTDNLKEMGVLGRRSNGWLNRKNPRAWRGYWLRDELQRLRRRENREIREMRGWRS